jgi:hypothetical protein
MRSTASFDCIDADENILREGAELWQVGRGARPERQRSHVRIVSGAPIKHVPSVPGLWRAVPVGLLGPSKNCKYAPFYLLRRTRVPRKNARIEGPSLLTAGVWPRLTALASRNNAFCAVPYFGTGGSNLLPLKKGSVLVVKFDRAAMRAGQTNPHDIIRLIQKGVKVYACGNLHAKVFSFGATSIVGSTNVSNFSADKLIEACAEISSPAFSKRCKAFVESLCGDLVELDYAEEMKKFYVPPKLMVSSSPQKNRKRTPQHSNLWLVSLASVSWSEKDYAHEEAGLAKAEQNLDQGETSKIERFRWSGGKLGEELRRGERVLMSTKIDNGKVLLSPPGRVLNIKKYQIDGKRRAIIYLAIPTNKRARNQKSFLSALGTLKKSLGDIRRTKRIRNPELVSKIGNMFI